MRMRNFGVVLFSIFAAVLSGCKGSSPSEPSAPVSQPPALTSISPVSGPTSGGTVVTITGSQFVSGATVTFGGSAGTGVSVSGSTSITATTPEHSAGAVSVVVTNPDGKSGQLANGFTYEEEGGIKLGLWEGTLPSAPSGSGKLSFRVTSQTSLTFISTEVPTFSNSSGCQSSWNKVVTISSAGAFEVKLTSGNTSLDIDGKFDSDVKSTGTIAGTCKGSLVYLGMTFRAEWVSN